MTQERRPEDLFYDPPGTVGNDMPPVSHDRPEGRPDSERGTTDVPGTATRESVGAGSDPEVYAGGAPGEAHGFAEGRTEPALAPPPANQGRTESMPPTPAHAEVAHSGLPSAGETPKPYPGAPTLDAAPDRPAIAVPGKPDGEVDTRT